MNQDRVLKLVGYFILGVIAMPAIVYVLVFSATFIFLIGVNYNAVIGIILGAIFCFVVFTLARAVFTGFLTLIGVPK